MSKPIIQAENNENVPVLEVNTPTGNVPVLPIESIGGGSEPVLESLSVNENGTYTPEEGVDGFDEVNVNVPQTTVSSITITENGTYNAPTGSAYSPVVVNVSALGIPVTNAKIVEEIPIPVEPEVLPEGMLYILLKGQQIVPPIPEDLTNIHSVICANTFNIQGDYDYITYDELLNATKFWLYTSDVVPRTRRDYISWVTWGNSATTSVPPTKVYEYDPSGPFEWVDITNDSDTHDNFVNNIISHDVRDCLYSDVVIDRFTVGNPQYLTVLNKVDSNCRINNIYYIDSYDTYLVVEGVAVYQNTYSMHQIISNYK